MRRLFCSTWLAFVLGPAAAFGCASSLGQAVSELESGRPAEADRRFRALEPAFPDFDPADRIRYALYRGLTHLTLGDVHEAERWLYAAKRVADRDAGALTDAERGRLLAAWRSMGHMPGDLDVTASAGPPARSAPNGPSIPR